MTAPTSTASPAPAYRPERVLVTGGCGFIGSNFIRHLLGTDPRVSVVNLDALTYAGNPENLADVEAGYAERYRFVHGDIRRHEDVAEAMRGCDTVVHFAAESHVDRSIAKAHDFITTNVEGTYVLLEEARRAGIGRFLHISTDEVYGSTESRVVQRDRPAGALEPLLGLQDGLRSPGALLSHHLRPAGGDHPQHQQLRALSVPGEAHPALRDQSSREQAGAPVR